MDALPLQSAFAQLGELRVQARRDADAALPATARQFEALFIQTLLKSMRDAELARSPFESDQTRLYREMFDQQISQELSQGEGIGIARVLTRSLGATPSPAPAVPAMPPVAGRFAAAPPAAAADDVSPTPHPHQDARWQPEDPQAFVQTLWPHAQRAAARLGISPRAIIAQAALETGWGRHQICHDDGRASFNLFGIKGGRSWQGERVEVPTTEFIAGQPQRLRDHFRSYPDLPSALADYEALLNRPRYDGVRAAGTDEAASAEALAAAGYATDPRYADKLKAIMRGPTLNAALADLAPAEAGAGAGAAIKLTAASADTPDRA